MLKMNHNRRTYLLALAVAACTGTSLAQAQSAAWPNKPIKYIVPFSPGGVSDAVARLVALHLTDKLGQSVIVENKPGV